MKNFILSLIQNDYAVIPGLLSPTDCRTILNHLDYNRFELAEKVVGPRHVRQNFYKIEISPEEYDVLGIGNIIGAIQTKLQFALNETIIFNDVQFQRYLPGETEGISPHHDGNEYRYCVAILLLEGESNFYLYTDGEGSNEQLITASVGDCIMLAAPGITEKEHGPYHGVANVEEERITLSLRHKSRKKK